VGSRDHSRVLSKELRYILSQGNPSPVPKPEQDRIDFNNFLLDNTEDFFHVLSLKGLFQYVSPSVRKVLEYDADELIGKSISHICHPADITPVIRELKESSSTVPTSATPGPPPIPVQKTVNLLFRARTRRSGYVWIESHGKMHIEPGKGRKSIILVGRRRDMPRLDWKMVHRAGGISDNEFWGLVSPDGLWLNVGESVAGVLGRPASSMPGTSLLEMLPDRMHQQQVLNALYSVPRNSMVAIPIVCQVRLLDSTSPHSTTNLQFPQTLPSNSSESHTPPNNLFEELDTTRHTSWQYELTHLRIANKNLLDDIAKLEIQQGLREPAPEPQSQSQSPEEGEGSSSRAKKRNRPETNLQNTEMFGT
jgi:hypothetical protein